MKEQLEGIIKKLTAQKEDMEQEIKNLAEKTNELTKKRIQVAEAIEKERIIFEDEKKSFGVDKGKLQGERASLLQEDMRLKKKEEKTAHDRSVLVLEQKLLKKQLEELQGKKIENSTQIDQVNKKWAEYGEAENDLQIREKNCSDKYDDADRLLKKANDMSVKTVIEAQRLSHEVKEFDLYKIHCEADILKKTKDLAQEEKRIEKELEKIDHNKKDNEERLRKWEHALIEREKDLIIKEQTLDASQKDLDIKVRRLKK